MRRYAKLRIKSVEPVFCHKSTNLDTLRVCRGTCASGRCKNKRIAAREVTRVDPDHIYAVVTGIHGDQRDPATGHFKGNDNGDFFLWKEELLRRRADKRYVYETWVGCPLHANHDENITLGEVKDAWPFAHCETCGSDNIADSFTCNHRVAEKGIDMLTVTSVEALAKQHRQLPDQIRTGQVRDVSMGCEVGHSYCSKCGNCAYSESDWCEDLSPHARNLKGKKDPDTDDGRWVYEDNRDCCGVELSWITSGEGADPMAKQKAIVAAYAGPPRRRLSPPYSERTIVGRLIHGEYNHG